MFTPLFVLPTQKSQEKEIFFIEVDQKGMSVDHDFFKTLGIEVLDGRTFSLDREADEQVSFILNEEAASQFDWNSAIDQEVTWYPDAFNYFLVKISTADIILVFHPGWCHCHCNRPFSRQFPCPESSKKKSN